MASIKGVLNIMAADARAHLSATQDSTATQAAKDVRELEAVKEYGRDLIAFTNVLKDIPPATNGSIFHVNQSDQAPRFILSIATGNKNDSPFDIYRLSAKTISVTVNQDGISCRHGRNSHTDITDSSLKTKSPEDAIKFIAKELVKMAPALCQNADKIVPVPGARGPGGMA